MENLLQIRTKTWFRDSHGLFDYESQSVNVNELQASSSCLLSRRESEIEVSAAPSSSLLSIQESQGRYSISSVDKIWHIIKDMGMHQLQEGDVLKLGRICMRVRELKSGQTDSAANTQDSSDEEIPD